MSSLRSVWSPGERGDVAEERRQPDLQDVRAVGRHRQVLQEPLHQLLPHRMRHQGQGHVLQEQERLLLPAHPQRSASQSTKMQAFFGHQIGTRLGPRVPER